MSGPGPVTGRTVRKLKKHRNQGGQGQAGQRVLAELQHARGQLLPSLAFLSCSCPLILPGCSSGIHRRTLSSVHMSVDT